MSEKTPIPATDPFRACRTVAVALSLLTLCAGGALAVDLAFRSSHSEHRAALRGIFQSVDLPAIELQRSSLCPPPWSRHDARNDWRFSPHVPAAFGAAAGAAPVPRGRPQ